MSRAYAPVFVFVCLLVALLLRWDVKGSDRVVYKTDRWTGQTWIIMGDEELPAVGEAKAPPTLQQMAGRPKQQSADAWSVRAWALAIWAGVWAIAGLWLVAEASRPWRRPAAARAETKHLSQAAGAR